MKKEDKELLNRVKVACNLYKYEKQCFDFVENLEFKKLDKDNPNNYEYAIMYGDKFLGHLEDVSDKTGKIIFVIEPEYWVHITKRNMEQILEFIDELEAHKKLRR